MNTSDHHYPLQPASLQRQHAAQSLPSRDPGIALEMWSLSLQERALRSPALTKLPASKGARKSG